MMLLSALAFFETVSSSLMLCMLASKPWTRWVTNVTWLLASPMLLVNVGSAWFAKGFLRRCIIASTWLMLMLSGMTW